MMSQISQRQSQLNKNYPTVSKTHLSPNLSDHTQLSDEDGNFVKNYQETPQDDLLNHRIPPLLNKRHPDGNNCIGRDCGILPIPSLNKS